MGLSSEFWVSSSPLSAIVGGVARSSAESCAVGGLSGGLGMPSSPPTANGTSISSAKDVLAAFARLDERARAEGWSSAWAASRQAALLKQFVVKLQAAQPESWLEPARQHTTAMKTLR